MDRDMEIHHKFHEEIHDFLLAMLVRDVWFFGPTRVLGGPRFEQLSERL
jgi:hypothetical protein